MSLPAMLRIFSIFLICVFSSHVHALTFKTGQVVGADGQVYDGASPAEREKLKRKAKSSGKTAGVQGANVFIIVEDDIVFVPVQNIAGKTNESVKNVITATVVNEITELNLEVDELSENIGLNDGDIEAAITATITTAIQNVEGGIDELNRSDKLAEIFNAANDYYGQGLSRDDISDAANAAASAAKALPANIQSVVNEIIDAAVVAVQDASSDIDAALSTWDSLSEDAKQAIVDEANRTGALGCGNGVTCTTSDAENLADSLR